MNLEESARLRRSVLQLLEQAVAGEKYGEIFAATAQLAKQEKESFENILELLYSFLTDLLESSQGSKSSLPRNPDLQSGIADPRARRSIWTGSCEQRRAWITWKAGCAATSAASWVSTRLLASLGSPSDGLMVDSNFFPKLLQPNCFFAVIGSSILASCIIRRSHHGEPETVSSYSYRGEGTAIRAASRRSQLRRSNKPRRARSPRRPNRLMRKISIM